jgi:hypothetical protein
MICPSIERSRCTASQVSRKTYSDSSSRGKRIALAWSEVRVQPSKTYRISSGQDLPRRRPGWCDEREWTASTSHRGRSARPSSSAISRRQATCGCSPGSTTPPAGDALRCLQEFGTVDVGTGPKVPGLVIGSNGGGLSYVATLDGKVHRTRDPSLDEPEFDQVAGGLRKFLELLEASLTRFVTDDEPGPW